MSNSFNPKVSIVIPVYNGSNYLKEAIDSALAQTYKNIEIIVINDGSTDENKTDTICKSYGKKIRYFKKENGGVATALNMGIEKMEGEYFSWLSHDDVYYPDKVEKQVKFLSKISDRKRIIPYANYELINEKSQTISFVNLDHEMLVEKPEYALLRGSINGITLLIPKSAFEQYGGFDLALKCTQDYDMWRKFMKSYKFLHMDDVFTKTRIHPLQDSNKHPNVVLEGDPLWIDLMKDLSVDDMKKLEGSEYNFYREMCIFLKSTPYSGALKYASSRMNEIYTQYMKRPKDLKVTVIIPFLNRLPLLFKTLKSVEAQTYKNLEILLINDGSTDDITKLKEIIKKDNRIKLVNLPSNKGAAAARNVGLEMAKGEYIAFLDSDDLFLPNKIETQLSLMYLTKYEMSHTSYLRRDGFGDILMQSGNLSGQVIPQIIGNCPIATPTVMLRTEYIRKIGIRFKENLRIGEDVCFWLEILRNTKLLGLEKAYTIVNVNSQSSSSNNKKQLQGLTNILAFILPDPEFSKYHHEISNLCNGFVDLSNRIYREENHPNGLKAYNFFQSKPNNPILKLIYLFRYQGIRLTIKKIIRKYGGKFLKI